MLVVVFSNLFGGELAFFYFLLKFSFIPCVPTTNCKIFFSYFFSEVICIFIIICFYSFGLSQYLNSMDDVHSKVLLCRASFILQRVFRSSFHANLYSLCTIHHCSLSFSCNALNESWCNRKLNCS